MKETPYPPSRIRTLVFGDHEILCEAIKTGLSQRFEIEFAAPPLLGADPWVNHPIEDLDLVIAIALSAETAPPELLTRASPYRMSRQTPLLIIAEEGQKLDLGAERAFRLDFPFTYDELYNKVAEILSHAPEYAGERGVAW
jgi:hypothetical protein